MRQKAKVQVYRNLHKQCWSLRYKGIVIAHAKAVEVDNEKFVVNEGGRERVRREKRKSVHAYITGDIAVVYNVEYTNRGDILPLCKALKYHTDIAGPAPYSRYAYYNPYTRDQFSDAETGQPLEIAEHVNLHENRTVTYKG